MYIGIEIGGTKLQLGVGAGDGVLRGLWREAVDVTAGPDGIREQILRAVPQLLSRSGIDSAEIQGIGIGFGGPVDDATCTIIKSHQIPGWDNFALAAWISDMLHRPAVLGNDADVAGLAEALFGAGKGCSPVFYITIGSGVGGGLIQNGKIYRGTGRGAAEIGHLRIAKQIHSALVYVPLEEVASGWAIENAFRSSDGRAWSAKEIARAAEQGDPRAIAILNSAWDSMAEGICHVITLLCPRRIVIGGGVSLMGERLLFAPLRERVAQRVFKPFADLYEIVPAALGEEVVVHGALALARSSMRSVPT